MIISPVLMSFNVFSDTKLLKSSIFFISFIFKLSTFSSTLLLILFIISLSDITQYLYAILQFLVSLISTINVNTTKIASSPISSVIFFPKVILENWYMYNATVIVNTDIIIATVFLPFPLRREAVLLPLSHSDHEASLHSEARHNSMTMRKLFVPHLLF